MFLSAAKERGIPKLRIPAFSHIRLGRSVGITTPSSGRALHGYHQFAMTEVGSGSGSGGYPFSPPPASPPPPPPNYESDAGMAVGLGVAVFVLLFICYVERNRFKRCCTPKRRRAPNTTPPPTPDAPPTAKV